MAAVTRLITGHCKNGHPRTPSTTAVRAPSARRPNGAIVCKVCRRASQKRYRAGLPPERRAQARRGPQASRATGSAQERVTARMEEIEFMLENGGRPEWGSWPWGNSAEALNRFLYRQERPDLARRFASQAKRERTQRERAERKAA